MAPMPFIFLIASFAMISSIKLPKLKSLEKWLNIFVFSNVIFHTSQPSEISEVLLFQAILYTVVGVIAYAIKPPMAADLNIEEEEETVEAIV